MENQLQKKQVENEQLFKEREEHIVNLLRLQK